MAEVQKVNVMQSYPGNSNTDKAANNREKAEAVVTGKASIKKPSVGKKFVQAFFGSNTTDIRKWARDNAIIWIKNTVLDGLSMMFFGKPMYNGSYRPNVVNGGSRYSIGSPIASQPATASVQPAIATPDYIIDYEVHADADTILTKLINRIEFYGDATVNDLFDYSQLSCPHTYVNWGWTSLATASITPTRDGKWRLNLPEPLVLRR